MRVERAPKVYQPVTIVLEDEHDFEVFRDLCRYILNFAPANMDSYKAADKLLSTLANLQ